jgi:hypothetical protein
MVLAFKVGDFQAHEPPYTEEEEYQFYKRMRPPVGMTSITRIDIQKRPALAAAIICDCATKLAGCTGPFRDLPRGKYGAVSQPDLPPSPPVSPPETDPLWKYRLKK